MYRLLYLDNGLICGYHFEDGVVDDNDAIERCVKIKNDIDKEKKRKDKKIKLLVLQVVSGFTGLLRAYDDEDIVTNIHSFV